MLNQNEIERAVIGMILDRKSYLNKALDSGLSSESFVDDKHRRIFDAIVAADQCDRPFDPRSLSVLLPEVADELYEIKRNAPIAQNFDSYLDEMESRAWGERTQKWLIDINHRITTRKIFEKVDAIRQDVGDGAMRLTSVRSDERGPVHIGAMSEKLVADAEQSILRSKDGIPSGISTGFKVLDTATGGLARGSINTFAARTGRGKTTLAVNLLYTAMMDDHRCAYFSVEMSNIEIIRKLISRASMVSANAIKRGTISDEETDRFMGAVRSTYQKHVWFDDSTRASFEALEQSCRRLKRNGGLDMICVDYIQQFSLAGRWGSPHERITAVSARLKQLALELDIVVVSLAQLNREAERSDELPDIWNIKDCGSIEQDSDLIVLIHSDENQTKLYVGKNRNGRDRFAFLVDAKLDINLFGNINLNLEAFK